VGGDVGRYVPPYAHGEDSLFFETFNRNARSLSTDLSTRAGRAVFEDLVRASDAVYSDLRGDVRVVVARFGGTGTGHPEAGQAAGARRVDEPHRRPRIRYDDLKHLNPATRRASAG
jgi:hypothetical protein